MLQLVLLYERVCVCSIFVISHMVVFALHSLVNSIVNEFILAFFFVASRFISLAVLGVFRFVVGFFFYHFFISIYLLISFFRLLSARHLLFFVFIVFPCRLFVVNMMPLRRQKMIRKFILL